MSSFLKIVKSCVILQLAFNVVLSLGFLFPSIATRTSCPNQFLLQQSTMTREDDSQNTDAAVIVGGGPTGLLSAICLAQKSERNFKISVYDRQPPPPSPTDDRVWCDFSKYYLIGLGGRGISALETFGVWEDVKGVSILVPGRQDWTPGSTEPVERFLTERKYGTYVLPRDKLVSVLNQHIVDHYAGRIDLFYEHEVRPVNFLGDNGNTVILDIANMTAAKTQERTGFRRISSSAVIATDGTARTFANQIEKEDRENGVEDPFSVVRFDDDNQRVFKIIHFRLPSDWRKDLNYAVRSSNDRIIFDALPANTRGDFVGNLLFKKDDDMAQPVDPATFRAFLDDVLPQFSPMFDDETVGKVAESPPSPLPMFRYVTPRMHQGNRCVILGDCAHTVKPYFGMGCNSALEDVKIFGDCIDNNSNISDAILDFSELRTKDIETLVKVSASLDKPGFMGLFTFLIPIILDGIFHKLAPQIFAQNVIAMLQREDMTFQEVAERKRKDRAAQLVSLGLLFAVATIVSDSLNALVVS